MCDEAMLEEWEKRGLTRRDFGLVAGVAAITACAAPKGDGASSSSPVAELREGPVQFKTEDGVMDGFFVTPAGRRAPAVLFWPDIGGLRESKRMMARRLAGAGHAVLVANPYYRDVAGEQFADFADFVAKQGFQKVGPWRSRLDAAAVMRDAVAAVEWLDAQGSVDTSRGIGTQGYCMTGSFALWSAAAVPNRIRAAASFHGGGLVRPGDPQSPHEMFAKMQASSLIAIAQNDDAKAPQEKDALREAASKANHDAEIEVYAADHGWCVPDSPSYDIEQAGRAWDALLGLYRAAL